MIPAEAPAASSLTEEQQRVADAPPNARILVTAGPGTGKTHLLIARIATLVRRYELSPGQEILVLSFSRAAVREIRRRIAEGDRAVRYVRAYTFDSFATRILTEIDPEGSWRSGDFDERVRCATALIHHDEIARDYISLFLHILIDEVQDLVGVRGEYVKALLEVSSAGFTLLGDPAQGIYNFSVAGKLRVAGSAVLYGWLREFFRATLEEHTLTVCKRAQSPGASLALPFGATLNTANPNFTQIKRDLEGVIEGLPSLGTVIEAAPVLRRSGNSTAVLCRNNGEALLISRALSEQNIPHLLQRRSTDRAVPKWVGLALNSLPAQSVGKTTFLKYAEQLGPRSPTPLEAWHLLKRMDRGRASNGLDIASIADRIRLGDIPDYLVDVPHDDLVVSTIHRAKGLEFDRVVIAATANDADDETDPSLLGEEARILYVALTRPKHKLLQMTPPKRRGLSLWRDVDRWVRRYEAWRIVDVEICSGDVHSDDPAGGFILKDCDAQSTQQYIRENVAPGDPVALTLLPPVSCPQCAHYAVGHKGRYVGVTSERFGALLYRILKHARHNVRWPDRIEELHVDIVDTVAGTSAAGLRCNLGLSGLWLRVRVSGLGRLMFPASDQADRGEN